MSVIAMLQHLSVARGVLRPTFSQQDDDCHPWRALIRLNPVSSSHVIKK
jgi:hypothetical protein